MKDGNYVRIRVTDSLENTLLLQCSLDLNLLKCCWTSRVFLMKFSIVHTFIRIRHKNIHITLFSGF